MSTLLTHTKELEDIANEMISYSAESVDFTKAVGYLKANLPRVTQQLRAIVGLSHQLDQSGFKILNEFSFKSLSNRNMVAIKDRKVLVPKGLNVSFIDYTNFLVETQVVVDELIGKTLAPAERFIGGMVNNPENLASFRPSALLRVITLHDIEKIKIKQNLAYSRDQAEKRPYASVIRRQADLLPTIKAYNSLVERTSRVNRDEVFEKMNNVANYADTIIQIFEEENTDKGVSSTAINNLGVFLHRIAQHVETYAVHCFKLEVLGNCLEELKNIK